MRLKRKIFSSESYVNIFLVRRKPLRNLQCMELLPRIP
uniref:Bm12869, isoform g n=1 Tax=Brugia malayi TaxID=6279 RepID=A0A1I9G644_BRUMA|nr:Bm12869, isoform g [Brugia malayi]